MRPRELFRISLLLITAYCTAQSPAHPEMLVSAQWLADHAKDPNLVILQISEKAKDFESGHVPGARWLPYSELILEHSGSMGEIPPVADISATLSRLGVSNDSHVVIYTTEWYPIAARGYYTLDYLGHGANTSLLDGGLVAWKAAGYSLESGNLPVKPSKFTPHVDEHVRATLEEAKAASDSTQGTTLIDARPRKRYQNGHIAGAQSLYWRDTVADEKNNPALLPPDKLQALFVEQGVTPSSKIITYCEVGYQASHDYFVAKYLGYNAQMYDGSYYEWHEQKHLPDVKGDQPR